MLSDFQNTRRDFLLRGGAGFGAMALTGMMAADTRITSRPRPALPSPNAPRQPHFAPTAKRVIFLFMEGGPSHMDLFDPKPLLNELAGQTMPASFKRPKPGNGVGRQLANSRTGHVTTNAPRPSRAACASCPSPRRRRR